MSEVLNKFVRVVYLNSKDLNMKTLDTWQIFNLMKEEDNEPKAFPEEFAQYVTETIPIELLYSISHRHDVKAAK